VQESGIPSSHLQHHHFHHLSLLKVSLTEDKWCQVQQKNQDARFVRRPDWEIPAIHFSNCKELHGTQFNNSIIKGSYLIHVQ